MKKLLMSSAILTAFALSITLFQMSCSKESHATPTTDTLTKKQMLVKYTWQVDEVLRNISGLNSHYKRNGENTTGVNYDILSLTFNSDGTGVYKDEVGIAHEITWQFSSADFRNITLNVGPPSAITYEQHLVEITKEAFHNTTAVGSDILVSARYSPTPRDTPDK